MQRNSGDVKMEQKDDSISWEVEIHVATDPYILGDLFKTTGAAFLLLAIMLSVIMLAESRPRLVDLLNMLELIGATVGVIFCIMWIVALVFFGNRYQARFTVNRKGTSYESLEKKAKTANRVAVVLGVFSGKPGVAGAGLLATGQESMQIRWRGVFKAVFNDRRRTIALRNAWRKILVIYCTEENYDRVAGFVKTQMESRKPPSGKSPLPVIFLHSILIILACVPLFQLTQWPFELDLFMPILTLSFALATLLFLPLFGIVVIGGLVVLLGMIFMSRVWKYGISLDSEGISLILAFIGMAYLAWFSLQAMRFKIPSLLMTDIEEMS